MRSLKTRPVSSLVRVAENSPGASPVVDCFCTCSVCGAAVWPHLSSRPLRTPFIPLVPPVSPGTQLKAYRLQLEAPGLEQWLIHKILDIQSAFKFSNTSYLRLLTEALPRNKCISIILLAKMLKENNGLILFKFKAKCAASKISGEKQGTKPGDAACF